MKGKSFDGEKIIVEVASKKNKEKTILSTKRRIKKKQRTSKRR
jgi:hypothetical protein